MWVTLKICNEGTEDIKQSKINTLTHQYELFDMEEDENTSMQIRFTNIVNKLQNHGKTISNQDCTNKILRCMARE